MGVYLKVFICVVLICKAKHSLPVVLLSDTTTPQQVVNGTLTLDIVSVTTVGLPLNTTNSTETSTEPLGDTLFLLNTPQPLKSSRFLSSSKTLPNQNSLTCTQLPRIPVCGRSMVPADEIATRVVGGSVATPHAYPWQGMLRYYKKLFCAVTVITENYVLTAAHCIIMMKDFQRKIEEIFVGKVPAQYGGIDLDYTSVVLGVYDMEDLSEGTFFTVDGYTYHENFSSDSIHDLNDIALLKLGRHIVYTDHIQPVCLPRLNEDFTNRTAVVTGWGQTVYNGSSSRYLKQGKVHLLADQVCLQSSVGDHFREDPRGMLCAYEYKTDACHGDSGGPLHCRDASGSYIQVGIVSWGKECAKVGFPGVYTEVANYISWIEHNIEVESCKGPL